MLRSWNLIDWHARRSENSDRDSSEGEAHSNFSCHAFALVSSSFEASFTIFPHWATNVAIPICSSSFLVCIAALILTLELVGAAPNSFALRKAEFVQNRRPFVVTNSITLRIQ
jgi:hypothetical protein